MKKHIGKINRKLGVNIDHVATLRNARAGLLPDPFDIAIEAIEGGADIITCHVREDRRHVNEIDAEKLARLIGVPFNFEMAPTEEMLSIALRIKPNEVCFVPEGRAELTTERGFYIGENKDFLRDAFLDLRANNIKISIFSDPDPKILESIFSLKPDTIELHSGRYCEASGELQNIEREKLITAAEMVHNSGFTVNIGHGLTEKTAAMFKGVDFFETAHVGHSIIAQALFCGMREAVRRFKSIWSDNNH